MMKKLILFLCFIALPITAQENKSKAVELSKFLSKTYYSVNLGGIFYPYSNANLPEGYATETFSRNPFSGRILLGYKFNPNLSIQYGVLRPAAWFKYDNVNNIGYDRSVWTNIWSLSLKKNFNFTKKTSFYAEVGGANVGRVGFEIGDEIIYPSTRFFSLIYGAGFNYKLSEKWRLSLNGVYIPESKKENQPSISQASVGFEYHLQQRSKKEAKEVAENEYFFPKNTIQIAYGNSGIGFGVNRFLSMNLTVGNFESFGIPVFWLGELKANHVTSIIYQRTAYRSRKVFSLDWGTSITYFQSPQSEDVFAFSIFPVIRFYLLRKPQYDFYTYYSVIGPTYITKSNIDGLKTGPNLTYQDAMGMGAYFGENRKYNFELKIMHYSNGNIFPNNAGVAIPIQFTLGRTF